MHVEELAEAIGQAHGTALDAVTRALWTGVAAGQIGDADAARLSAAIDARRPAGKPEGGRQPARAIRLRPKPQRCPDRAEALERSRRWAASGRMPPAVASKFTQGEQAALAVIAFEVTKRKFCDKAMGAIAALAGISESTVKRAIRHAKAIGLLTVEERRLSRDRNDTNVVRIVGASWLSWIELRGAGGGVQRRPGTNTVRDSNGDGGKARAPQGLPGHRNDLSGASSGQRNRAGSDPGGEIPSPHEPEGDQCAAARRAA